MKTAVISGGTGGIGRAVAHALATDGFRVVLLARPSSTSDVDAFLKQLPGEGHVFHGCDLTHEGEAKTAIQEIIRSYGAVDACVHCAAAPLTRKSVLDLSAEEFRQPFETDVFGGFELLQAAAIHMKERKEGRIVACTSAALAPNTSLGRTGSYLAAKFAVRGLLRELARELAPLSVTVNAIAPAFISTPLSTAGLPPRALELLQEKNVRGRFVTAEEAAAAVSFLCSEKASGVTGTTILIGGGDIMDL